MPIGRFRNDTEENNEDYISRVPYDEALSITGIQRLKVRRQELTDKLFVNIICYVNHILYNILPPRNFNDFNLAEK